MTWLLMTLAATQYARVFDLKPRAVAALTKLFGPSHSSTNREPLVISSVSERVSWQSYEWFLSEIDERRLRHTYCDGVLEIMSPRMFERETTKSLLRRFVQSLTLELKLPICSLGTTTLGSPSDGAGIEPDESFHFGREFDDSSSDYHNVDRFGPPAFAIEVSAVSSDDDNSCVNASAVDRRKVLERLGISEIWLVERDVVQIRDARGGLGQMQLGRSSHFPNLTGEMLTTHLRNRHCLGESDCITQFIFGALKN